MPVLNGVDLTLGRDLLVNGSKTTRQPYYSPKIVWNGNMFYPPSWKCVLYLTGYPGQGSKISDYSGNKNDGALTATGWSRNYGGLFVNSYNGTSSFIDFGQPASLSLPTTCCINMWVKPTLYDSSERMVLATRNSGSVTLQQYCAFITTGNNFQFSRSDGADPKSVLMTTAPTINKWSNICAIDDNTNLTWYMNGFQNCTPVSKGGISVLATLQGNVWLGKSDIYFYKGFIGAVAVSSVVPSSSQMQKFYTQNLKYFASLN